MNCFGDYKKSSIFAPAIEKRRIRHLGGFHLWVLFSFIHQLVAVYTMVYTSANHISIRLNIIHY